MLTEAFCFLVQKCFSPLSLIFGVVWDYYSSKLKGKQYKQNTTSKSYKTEIKIIANVLSLLFFFVIERSVLMALVFYNKGMLEKVLNDAKNPAGNSKVFTYRKNPVKVISLKLFYYQTFFETWSNEHSWYQHYKYAIKKMGSPCLFTRQQALKIGYFYWLRPEVRQVKTVFARSFDKVLFWVVMDHWRQRNKGPYTCK